MPKIIHYVSAVCGGGKTSASVTYINNKHRENENILFVQPSTKLIGQTLNQNILANPDSTAIAYHSADGSEKSVVPRVSDHLRNAAPNSGQRLFITHACFELLGFIPNRNNWHVIHDEVPEIQYCEQFCLNEYAHILLNLFEVIEDIERPNFYALKPLDYNILDQYAQNISKDQVIKQFEKFARKLRNPNFHMRVEKKAFNRFKENIGKKNIKSNICFSGHLASEIFDGYASVTMLAACFEESLIAKIWRDVEFKEHSVLKNMLTNRTNTHTNGHRLTIHYVFEKDWSKNVRNKIVDEDIRVKDIIVAAAIELFKEKPFVFMDNKDEKDPFEKFRRAMPTYEQLPNSVHGINEFRHYDNVVIFSALNAPPPHYSFLNEVFGIDSETAKIAGYRQNVYQAVSRTSLRDQFSDRPVTALVMDLEAAKYLQVMYPNAKIQKLAGIELDDFIKYEAKEVGRPVGYRKYETEDEKKAASKEKNRIANKKYREKKKQMKSKR